MKAKIYKQSSSSTDVAPTTNKYVREALEKQAARRPAPTPPREMPVTPKLPRMKKVKRRRWS